MFDFLEDESAEEPAPIVPPAPIAQPLPVIAEASAGEKGKARDILAAVKIVRAIETERRSATHDERTLLARFPGFGPVALSLFPDPIRNAYKDESWRELGEELKSLLSPEDYASAKRTTFTAFYTSPVVTAAIYNALDRMGVPANARVLEPGCGSGNFMALAPSDMQFVAVEQDTLSARIARTRFPAHDIRTEDFHSTRLPADLDAVVGNVPFADIRLDHKGQRLALHDYFIAKSADALRPGGILALVTSHYTLDKQNAAARELLSASCDFVGAIRLPSDAFKREGTAVVTDILILRRREPGHPVTHADPDWLGTSPLALDDRTVTVNRYFLNHPEMVLGSWCAKDTLYGTEGYSVTSTGDLRDQLRSVIALLPERRPPPASQEPVAPVVRPPAFIPPSA